MSSSSEINLRSLLESNEPTNHLPKAFRQMHDVIVKAEIYTTNLKNLIRKLRQDIKLKDEIIALHESDTNNECNQLVSYIETLKEEIRLKDEIIALHKSSEK